MSYRIIFMGTPAFAVPILESLHADDRFDIALVISQPDKPQGRKRELIPTPIAAFAKEHELDLWQPAKVRDLTFLDRIRNTEADFIVTAAYGRILTDAVLAAPRYGAVNVHASLLPAYRGASPVHWSIINGDDVTGISVMLMDSEMDHGDILRQKEIEIPPYMTTDILMGRLGDLGAEAIGDALVYFAEGRITPVMQDHEKATYVSLLTREAGHIDWSQSSFDIHNLVRGTYPWPGAYTSWQGKRLKIHKARMEDNLSDEIRLFLENSRPGTVILSHKETLLVSCGEGVLAIEELQPEGSRRMPVEVISHNIEVGTVFGQEMNNE